ncbi:MAG: CoA-binding protein [Betaproteobacteria bacterium]|nr:CoA-binding protein [Betaproteobacteria bacterium]
MLAPDRSVPYTREQLLPLIAPGSIAVVGASPRNASFGLRTLENLAHYRGDVYPVNAKYADVGGFACYPSLAALPKKPDCVVLVVPREAAEAAVEDCAKAGAGSVIVFASGYGEMSQGESAEAQQRLVAIARAANMPLLGPNCMGLVNHELGAGMSFIPEYARMPRKVGPIAFVSQSGAMGYCLAQAAERGLGYRYFFSSGNSSDVDVADLIAAMAEDPEIRAIACLFEGVPSAARLLEAGERARRHGKPVIVYKLGVSADGAAAARSHTGSLAGSAVAFRALFERAGFAQVDDYEALVEYAKFFAAAGKPLARGVAAVSGSGGAGVIAADMAERHAVPMPQPGEKCTAALKSVVPEFGAARNPCDPTGQVLSVPESYGKCCRALLEDPQYGVLLCLMSVATHEVGNARAATIAQMAREQPKPVAVVWVSEWLQGPGSESYEGDDKVGLFRSMDRCYAAIAAWQRWHEGIAPQVRARRAAIGAREKAAALLAAAGATLTEREAKQVFAAYGVPVVEERLARSADEAAAAARALGFPVALKVESPAIPHKTEAGVVRLSLVNEAFVREAWAEVMDAARKVAADEDIRGVLVQPMAEGVEIIVGARIDPLVGALVVVGSGGVMVELMKDSVASLAPVSLNEARTMLAGLKGYPLLTGFRGSAPADIDAVAEVVVRVSEFAADFAAQIEELDVNPLRCGAKRVIAVDGLITKKRKA